MLRQRRDGVVGLEVLDLAAPLTHRYTHICVMCPRKYIVLFMIPSVKKTVHYNASKYGRKRMPWTYECVNVQECSQYARMTPIILRLLLLQKFTSQRLSHCAYTT